MAGREPPLKRVRFAPSPTGTLHSGNALSAVANRAFGDWMLLRIDDTDAARNVPGGEEAIVSDLEWLGGAWGDFARQAERAGHYAGGGARRSLRGRPRRSRDDAVRMCDASPRGRQRDLPARVGGGRHRLRDHARD